MYLKGNIKDILLQLQGLISFYGKDAKVCDVARRERSV